MSGPFPIKITGNDGIGMVDGEADFPDPANHPTSNDAPFKCAVGADVVMLEDHTGATILVGGEDSAGIHVNGTVEATVAVETATLFASGPVDLCAGPTDPLGFYGAAGVAQPAAPITLGDVIAALKALGLVAT